MLRVSTAALAVLLCTACDGSGKAQPEAKAAAAKPEAKQAEAEAKAPEPAASEPAASEPPAAAAADPLGQRFRDPPWFRETMFGDKGTKVDFARSEANEAGLFKSHLVFELGDGTTVEDCVTMVTEALKDAVELSREDQADRTQLTGSADRYDVTAVCGEGKGKMRAYVAYEWTR